MKTIYSLSFLFVTMILFSCTNTKSTVVKKVPVFDNPAPDGGILTQPTNSIISLFPSSPVEALPFKEFCRRDNRGFIMIFQNSGNLQSSEFQGTITFGGHTPIIFTVPEIPARVDEFTNSFTEVVIPITQMPADCTTPNPGDNCSFSIQWSNQPPHTGQCIG